MARKAARKATGPRKGAARKRDYAAEYARRTRGTKPGTKERQAARGHKPPRGKTESQVKRERRDARIEAFAERQAARWPRGDAEEIAEALRELVREKGMRALQQIERWVTETQRLYMAQTARDARGRRPTLGLGSEMDEMAIRYSLPVETFGYH